MTTPTTTDPYETNWRVDDDGLLDCGGDVGGDAQATESWTFRFVQKVEPDDGLHAIITEYWYGEDLNVFQGRDLDEDAEPQFTVGGYAEITVCRDLDDPGSTEVWSDIERDGFDDADVRIYSTAEAAHEAAKRAAQRSLSMPYAWLWDGRSPIR